MHTSEKFEKRTKSEGSDALPLNTETPSKIENMSLLEKIKYVISNITVEPALGFFVMSSLLARLATQNLNLEKACRVNLAFGDDVCNALKIRQRGNHSFEEEDVQKLIAFTQSWTSIIHTTIPTLLMCFMGAWSDKTGRRKICILLPIFGEFMTCVLNITNTYFFYQVPVEWTVFMEILFPALFGGWNTLFLGCFSYIGDITSSGKRTFRMGLLSLCMTIGYPTGMGLSGILLRLVGYYGVFGISAALQFMNFCYVLLCLDDHRWLENKEKKNIKSGAFFREFFNIQCLKETLGIAFKGGPNKRRLRIVLILTVVCLYFGPMWGEMSVTYIFTRFRFNWDALKYSIFSTYSLITHMVGTLFCISVLSKRLGVDDAVLGMISTISKILGAVIMSFARNDVVVFCVPLIEILNGTTVIALRSIASKVVSPQELGKVYSLFGVADATMHLVFVPTYSRVYIATLKVLPGSVFLLSAVAMIPAFAIFWWFYVQHKKDKRRNRMNLSSESPEDGTLL